MEQTESKTETTKERERERERKREKSDFRLFLSNNSGDTNASGDFPKRGKNIP